MSHVNDDRLRRRVLLIGWDAADWKVITPLLEAGQMPALASLIERGCMGNIATLQPPLSPILWTSIVTGKRADKHGIVGFVEPDPTATAVRPATSTSRRCKALWNLFTQADRSTHAIGFFASHPAEPINGVCVSNAFTAARTADEIPRDAIHPPGYFDRVSELRVSADEIGDADLRAFIPRLAGIDRHADLRPRHLAAALANAASVQAVLTSVLQHEPWDFVAAYFDAIDVVSHHFMPFHPPRMDGVSERDFELYRDVVAGVYRFHDMMLSRVLELAGEDVNIVLVSDHGFFSDHLRPKPSPQSNDADDAAAAALDAQWHRPHGVLVVAGPNVKPDERVYGATLLDVTPTVLALAGLPIGRDMDGNVLMKLFETSPDLRFTPSWETEVGNAGQHPANAEPHPHDHAVALRQLAELGYLESADSSGQRAVARSLRDADCNLAMSELSADRPQRAIELLEPIYRADADQLDERIAATLADAYHRTGRTSDAAAIAQRIHAREPTSINARLMLAAAHFAEDRSADAIALLEACVVDAPTDPRVHAALATVYIKVRDATRAESAYRRALEIDDTNVDAWDGLAVALLLQDRHAEAADAALEAVGLLHHFPRGHLHLGIALTHLGERERALQPLQLAAQLEPSLLEAHRYLATIYRERGELAQMVKHRDIAERLIASAAGKT